MAISILNDLLLFSCLAALHCLHFANLGVLGQVRSGPDENRLSHTVFQWRGVFTKLEYLILNHHTRLLRQIGSNNKTSLVMAAIANAPYVSAVCVQTSAS
jgi:hypothetical protein